MHSIPRYLPKRNKSICPNKGCTQCPLHFPCDSQHLGTTQMSTNRRTDRTPPSTGMMTRTQHPNQERTRPAARRVEGARHQRLPRAHFHACPRRPAGPCLPGEAAGVLTALIVVMVSREGCIHMSKTHQILKCGLLHVHDTPIKLLLKTQGWIRPSLNAPPRTPHPPLGTLRHRGSGGRKGPRWVVTSPH